METVGALAVVEVLEAAAGAVLDLVVTDLPWLAMKFIIFQAFIYCAHVYGSKQCKQKLALLFC